MILSTEDSTRNEKINMSTPQEEGYNYGLAILRILITFTVVLNHYWGPSGNASVFEAFVDKSRPLAVPIFMLLSFFFIEKKLSFISADLVKERMKRLMIPYFSWAIIYFTVELVLFNCFEVAVYDTNYNLFSQLGWQILLGSATCLNPPFWFMAVLIFYTLSTFLIFRFLRGEKPYFLLTIIALISLILQYSGINVLWFGKLEYEQRWTLGRGIEMLPYIVLGLSMSKSKIGNRLREHRWVYLTVLLIMIFICYKYTVFAPLEGFGYGGIYLILLSCLVFIFFSLLPINLAPKCIKSAIKFVSKYSFGVFCMHFLGGKILYLFIYRFSLNIDKFLVCIIIFAVCFGIAVVISRIPLKYTKFLVS